MRKNPGASLVDLGDGVGCIELHSKKNAIGEDIVRMVTQTLRPDSDAVRNFEAFVITRRRRQFLGRRQPDAAAAERPGRGVGRGRPDDPRLPADDADHQILPAPGRGGAVRHVPRRRGRDRLHAVARQAHAELYMGLVETGVGLLPGGGGCKEMTLRAIDSAGAARMQRRAAAASALRNDRDGEGSTSAVEARRLGFLTPAIASP